VDAFQHGEYHKEYPGNQADPIFSGKHAGEAHSNHSGSTIGWGGNWWIGFAGLSIASI